MKKILLISIFTSILASVSLQALEIQKTKKFTLPTEQNGLETTFKISSKASQSNTIEKSFNKAINYVEKSNICTGGAYRIYPNYTYQNSKRVEDGYKGEITFNCNFQDTNSYEKLINKIKYISNIKLTQNKINIKLKDITPKLEYISFDFAKKYINTLHTHFQKCGVKTIDFSNNRIQTESPYLLQKSISRHSESTNITAPIQKSLTQSIHVNYSFVCDTTH